MIHLMKLLALFVSSVNKLEVKRMPAACEWFLYLILSFGHILPFPTCSFKSSDSEALEISEILSV